MRITIAFAGADGDEYVHTFVDAEFTTEAKPGMVTVTGRPTNGKLVGANARDPRTEHYPVGRVLRVIESEAVQS